MFGGRSSDTKLYLFNTGSGANGNAGSVYDTFIGNIWGVSVSKDSQLLAAGGVGGNLYILNISTVTANPLPLVSRHAAQTAVDVNTVRFSFDGNYIATGRADGVIDIYAKNCLQCPMTSYINGTTCRSCNTDMIGCSLCRNSTYCIACLLNYYVDTTTGPAGTQLCKLCDSLLDGCAICKSSSVCIKCDQNYYLNGNTCAKCSTLVPDCDECRSNGTCIKCSFYTYLTSTATCDRCNLSITNCLRCS